MRRRALPFVSAIVLSSGIHAAAVLVLGPLEGGVRASGAEAGGLLVSLAPPPVVPHAGESVGAEGEAAAEETEAAGGERPADPPPVEPKAAAEALDTARFDAPDPPRVVRRASAAAAPERREISAEAPAEAPTEAPAEAPGEIPAEVAAAAQAPPDAAGLPAPPRYPPSPSPPQAEGGAPDLVDPPEPAPRPPAAAGMPAPPNAGAAEDYHARLRAWLERHKRYPRRARRRREQGVVVLRFVADRMGAVLDLEIEETSGHPLLDEAALDMVRRAQPLPEMPPVMRESRAEHLLPVRFALR